MTEIQKILFNHQDKKYAAFSAKLIPTEPLEKFIGVRSPEYKKILNEIKKIPDEELSLFLKTFPHDYHEENVLEVYLINSMNFEDGISTLENFLPYITNWAVSDSLRPKSFEKNKDKLLPYIKKWIQDDKPYTKRVGTIFLMKFFLDSDFKPEYLELPAAIRSTEYYVNMMTAWFFAEALTKQWDYAIPFILEHRLDSWTHNKAIQKAIESRRITQEQKDYLRTLKIKASQTK